MGRTVVYFPLLEDFMAPCGIMNSILQGGGVQVSSGKGDPGPCF